MGLMPFGNLHQLLSVAITMVTRYCYCRHTDGRCSCCLGARTVKVHALDNVRTSWLQDHIQPGDQCGPLVCNEGHLLFTEGGHRQLW